MLRLRRAGMASLPWSMADIFGLNFNLFYDNLKLRIFISRQLVPGYVDIAGIVGYD